MFGLFRSKPPIYIPPIDPERMADFKKKIMMESNWGQKYCSFPTKTIYGNWVMFTRVHYFWFSYTTDATDYEIYYATATELAQLRLGNTDIIIK